MALVGSSACGPRESKAFYPSHLERPAPVKTLDYTSIGDCRPRTGPSSINSRERLASNGRSSLLASRAKELDSKRPEANYNILPGETSSRPSSRAAGQARPSTTPAGSPSRSQASGSAIKSAAKVQNPVDPLDSLLDEWLQEEGGDAGSRLVSPSSKFDADAKLHPEPLGKPTLAHNEASSNTTTWSITADSSYLKVLQERALELRKERPLMLDHLSLDEVPDDAKSTGLPISSGHEGPRSPSDRDAIRSPVFSDAGSVISSMSRDNALSPRMSSRVTSAGSTRSSVSSASKNKPRFDLLTLREWFIEMDQHKNGHVTKTQWLDFMRRHQQLVKLMVSGSDTGALDKMKDRFSEEAMKKLSEEARQMKRLRSLWTDIDADGNGTLEFEEFVEFFRQGGFFLEYKGGENARVRLAGMLGDACEKEVMDGQQEYEWQQQFKRMSSMHLHGAARQSLFAVWGK